MPARSLEQDYRALARVLAKRGITVRRENLTCGVAYQARSGTCSLSGAQLVFVDRRLPIEQQISVLIDYCVDGKLTVGAEEVAQLAPQFRVLLSP